MKHGPLHSEVLDLINGQHRDEAKWSRHFRNGDRNAVVLEEEPDTGKLSRHKIELLNRVADERLLCTDWDAVDDAGEARHQKRNLSFHNVLTRFRSSGGSLPIRTFSSVFSTVTRRDNLTVEGFAKPASFQLLTGMSSKLR